MAERYDDEIDLGRLFRKLIASWRPIVLTAAAGAVAGLVIGFSIPREYTTTCKLAPEIMGRSSVSGNLSYMANLAGVNLAGMSTADAMLPDIYPEVIASTPFIVDLFGVPVEYGRQRDTSDVYGYFLEHTRKPWWSHVIAAPFTAVRWFVNLFQEKQDDAGESGYAEADPYELTKEQAAIAKAIGRSFRVSVEKKTYIVTMSVTTQDPHVSAAIADAAIRNLKKFVVRYRTDKARNDVAYYQQIYDDALQRYLDAQNEYALFMDANQNISTNRARVEQERLRNEANLAYQLYNQCSQQLQVSKGKVQQETPVCTVLQPASVPGRPSRPSKMMLMMTFAMLGACAAAVWVLARK